jgi:hypothetical protein
MIHVSRCQLVLPATPIPTLAVTVFPMSGKDVPGQGGGEVKGGVSVGGGGVEGAGAGGGPEDPIKVSVFFSTCDCESVIKLVSTGIRAPLTLLTSHPKTNPSKAQLYVLQMSPLVSPAQCGGGEILRIQCATLF